MAYGTPQSMMYNMRGRGTDGSMIRNRSREQQFSGSGNPNMPIFNTGRMDPRQPQAGDNGNGMGGVGGYPMPQFLGGPGGQFPSNPTSGVPGQLQTMGTALGVPAQSAPLPQFTPQQQALRAANIARAQGPQAAIPGSAASYNYNYNTAPGQSPFAAAIAAMHSGKNPVPMPSIDTSRNPTAYAPQPQAPINTSRNPTQYAPIPGSYNG